MAFTSVKRLKSEASQNEQGLRETWTYHVQSDSPTDTPADALTATDGVNSIPAYMAQHSTKSFLYVTSKEVRHHDEAQMFFVITVTYSTPAITWPEADPNGRSNFDIKITGVQRVENSNRDINNKAITNAFGDVFAAEIPFDRYDGSVVVNYTCTSVNTAAIFSCMGKANSDPLTISIKGHTLACAAKTLRLLIPEVGYTVDPSGNPVWRVTLPFLYRSVTFNSQEIGHNTLVVQKGYNYKDANNKPVKSETEVFLAADGKKLAAGADAVLKLVENVYTADFSGLLAGMLIA